MQSRIKHLLKHFALVLKAKLNQLKPFVRFVFHPSTLLPSPTYRIIKGLHIQTLFILLYASFSCPYFFGIMLYPSYLRVELLMFYIYPMQQFAIFREQHGFCCRSTLIYGNYSANHTIRFKKDMFIFSRIQGQSCRCPLYPIRNGQRFHGSFHEPRSHRGCR